MDGQDPTIISKRLGIEPTHAHRKGDLHPTRTNPDLKWRNSIGASGILLFDDVITREDLELGEATLGKAAWATRAVCSGTRSLA